MKKPASSQRCSFAEADPPILDAKVKCVTVMVFEESGKTIIQPLLASQETTAIQKLLKNGTLEVWLPNGKSEASEFDISILKYKQVAQPLTKCGKLGNKVCLKNYFETITSCEKCPLTNEETKN